MEAVMLNSKGFYAEAEVRLKRLAALHPEQPTVREMLREVQTKLQVKEQDPVVLLQRKLKSIVLPVVKFREANARDVIEFLQVESAKLAADKTEINFVWQLPANAPALPITLNLKNVPLTEVLNYVTQLAGLRYRVDAYAVVIYKPDAPVPAPNVKPE